MVYQSWGGFPKATECALRRVYCRSDNIAFDVENKKYLPYAYGRSYGDSCLNEDGVLLLTNSLKHFITFDAKNGLIRCEAGVTLGEILKLVTPKNWFLPVLPGTQTVSVGGAIANDVHGKNHHINGNFGHHITCFELLRSNGNRLFCSPKQNSKLFYATIGGLGLTGLILWAEVKLKRIKNYFLEVENIKFYKLEDFFKFSQASLSTHEYLVAWLDCHSKGKNFGRGIFTRANHCMDEIQLIPKITNKASVPFCFPNFSINKFTIKLLNNFYFYKMKESYSTKIMHYQNFLFPLDNLLNWNRIYGKRGFLQYQCVVPYNKAYKVINDILKLVVDTKLGSFLSVLKNFGDIKSLGLLSFPRHGITLAIDFPYRGRQTLILFDKLDSIVCEAKGAVYPAKDARMSSSSFKIFFPNWENFKEYIDPKFSSNFWKRVMEK